MVPAMIPPPHPVPGPADTNTSAGSPGRTLAGTPAPPTAAAPTGGTTWTQEV
jgi:hypothetical protein